MAKKPKYTNEQRIKLLNKTRKLSSKEAALKLGISIQALYKWRSDLAKIATTPVAAPEVAPVVAAVAPVVAKVEKAPKAKAPTVNIKRIIKAVDSIKTSLNTIDSYLQAVNVA